MQIMFFLNVKNLIFLSSPVCKQDENGEAEREKAKGFHYFILPIDGIRVKVRILF